LPKSDRLLAQTKSTFYRSVIVVVGIDLGKNSCSLVGLDESGQVVLQSRLRRDSLERIVGDLPPCIVAMVAWAGEVLELVI
jgi:hypothetical protein